MEKRSAPRPINTRIPRPSTTPPRRKAAATLAALPLAPLVHPFSSYDYAFESLLED